ncbi:MULTISPECIES: winged helix-turn-helix transcriptional regulator [unclassified Brevibacterium]|uniref:winged helix-turn-helix transcriptional regulator n=1 Tax=unclassified Brevibacterium TaxID=2614124 RepID=UPI0010931113|nr:helix-turn-helix domain-containing protein [Brevibacterium sp. S22]TGD32610.1 transcriptional regulator [Brevibacterium sp. S22]
MKETSPDEAVHSQITGEHRELIDQILDKWSLLVLDKLCKSPRRFNELRRASPTASQKSLTTSLHQLERNGMIERMVLDTRPVAVEYRISDLCGNLQDLKNALLIWTTNHMAAVQESHEMFDAEDDA